MEKFGLLLVNGSHPLPDGYEDWIRDQLVEQFVPLTGKTVILEKETLNAANRLLDMMKDEGVGLILCDGFRTVEQQQAIVDRFTIKYGPDYVRRYVAIPGKSEHHTGLAIDFFLVKDGKVIRENLETMKETVLWAKVKEKAPDAGLILRYPEGKEAVTGVAHEPWHFRYVGNDLARKITNAGITLEEYVEKNSSSFVKEENQG